MLVIEGIGIGLFVIASIISWFLVNILNSCIDSHSELHLCRFIGIFKFIYDHVFGPFPQRAYADPSEKWQLVIACLKHFQMQVLSQYSL